jgi:hypothetical protein
MFFRFLDMLSDDADDEGVQLQGACNFSQMSALAKQRPPQAESGAEAERIQRLHNTVPGNENTKNKYLATVPKTALRLLFLFLSQH